MRTRPRPYCDCELADLTRWWHAGLKLAAIARRLGRGKGSVERKARQLGLPRRHDAPARRRRLAPLFARGLSDRECARRAGLARSVVAWYRKRMGYPSLPRGGANRKRRAG